MMIGEIVFWLLAAAVIFALLQWLVILRLLNGFLAEGRAGAPGGASAQAAGHDGAPPNGLSVIVPIKGADDASRAALEHLANLPLGAETEILFVMEEESDPAYGMVKTILERRGARPGRGRIVLSGPCGGRMGKLHNMRAGLRQAAYDHLLFMDADVVLTPEAVEHGLKKAADPKVGAVSAIPLYHRPASWGGLIIAAWTNDYFLPCLLGLRRIVPFPFIVGACFFTRRGVLEADHLLEEADRYISDDAHLSERMHRAGLETRVLPYAVTMTENKTFPEGCRHLLRWFVMLKSFKPPVYFSILNWHFIFLALAAAVIACFTGNAVCVSAGAVLLAAAVAGKLLGAAWFNNRLKEKEPPARYWKIIVYECAVFPWVWLAGWFKRTLVWRGRTYTVGRGGVIRSVEDA